ncbi:JAB domain-containing protein [Pedobacter cryotolerans]|uniref:DNA repair protein n=1 Tax=Pedobacter cryotolerans TaxID=2571270 RepID=A0A4U1C444_9SPHI|nr:JAB domain-containing protein [Pedobacter cryotolerans]TKC00017.1 DNA repair protein [Pedobacter cryotolerans]
METLQINQLMTVAEVTLRYRPKIKPSNRPVVKCSKDAYEILLGFWNLDKIEFCEQFCVMLLNNRGRVLGVVELSSGGFNGTVADPKMIFGVALKACASSIVIAHNHPSGDLKPSSQDIKVTERLVAAGKLLDLAVNDHLIVTTEGYRSLADDGYI